MIINSLYVGLFFIKEHTFMKKRWNDEVKKKCKRAWEDDIGLHQAHKSMENTESDPSNARNQPLSNSRKTDEQAMKRL